MSVDFQLEATFYLNEKSEKKNKIINLLSETVKNNCAHAEIIYK